MRGLLAGLLLMVVAVPSLAEIPTGPTGDYYTYLAEVNSYIAFFHRNFGKWVNKRVARMQKNIAPLVVEQALAHGVDPLLVAIIISYESSWVPKVVGARGEIGLMQVMEPRFKPETISDELLLGTEKLQIAVNKCANITAALTHYGSGYCKARTARTKKLMEWRYKRYLEAIEHCRKPLVEEPGVQ